MGGFLRVCYGTDHYSCSLCFVLFPLVRCAVGCFVPCVYPSAWYRTCSSIFTVFNFLSRLGKWLVKVLQISFHFVSKMVKLHVHGNTYCYDSAKKNTTQNKKIIENSNKNRTGILVQSSCIFFHFCLLVDMFGVNFRNWTNEWIWEKTERRNEWMNEKHTSERERVK